MASKISTAAFASIQNHQSFPEVSKTETAVTEPISTSELYTHKIRSSKLPSICIPELGGF
jgi:hypothetical protein